MVVALPDRLSSNLLAALDRLDSEARQQQYRTDPALWVSDVLGEHLWSKQVEIVTALTRHRKVAVKSAHGCGKSHTASRVVAHWLATRTPGQAFAVTTAPSAAQVQAILWRYIGQAAAVAAERGTPLPGRVLTTEWKLGKELIGFGRKPPDTEQGRTAFQGIHAPDGVLVALDEASGIPGWLWTAADALTTNEGCALLAIGNPADPSSEFAQVCRPGSGWHVITISAFDTPNLTGERVPDLLRRALVSKTWVEEKRADWGEGSPLWFEKVLGEFPLDASDQVVRSSDLAKCRQPTDREYTPDELTPVVLGVDVGGGGDETVIRERRGRMVGREWRDRDDDTMSVVRLVLKAIEITGATAVNVDSIGIGAGVADRLKELRGDGTHTATVTGVNVGQQATDSKRFANLRSEIWWEVGRLQSEQQAWDLSPAVYNADGVWQSGAENPDDACNQLLTAKWHPNSRGQIQVEPKDDQRERLGRSPDNADALILAFVDLRGDFASFMDQLIAESDANAHQQPPPEAREPAAVDMSAWFGGGESAQGWRRTL